MSPVLGWPSVTRVAALPTALLTLVIFASVTGHAQSKDADAIKALNEAWIHSYLTKDTAAVARIWADDFFLINPAGQRYTRQDGIKNMSNPAIHFLSSQVDTAEVNVVGNLGYIHARASFVSADDAGKQTKGKTDYLDVYEKRKGRWVCIAAHVIYLGNQ
jgi:uncharacterized protein (TIGR02246 family)